jgi:hypothetical protein
LAGFSGKLIAARRFETRNGPAPVDDQHRRSAFDPVDESLRLFFASVMLAFFVTPASPY